MTKENNKNYYSAGNTELATDTPLTLMRLEPRRKLTKNSERLVIALVGLPARGKSFVARKMEAYLNWSGVETKIFNVGRYRRDAYAKMMMQVQQQQQQQQQQLVNNNNNSERTQKGACDADFFDANNESAAALREAVAEMALRDMLRWLDDENESPVCLSNNNNGVNGHKHANGSTNNGMTGDLEVVANGSEEDLLSCSSPHGVNDSSRHTSVSTSSLAAIHTTGGAKLTFKRNGKIAIFDATNSTKKRRQWILEECTSPVKRVGKPTGVVFVESICDDQELLDENYRYKINSSPDFEGMSLDKAMDDLKRRVEKYEAQYETVDDDSMSYIKVFNLSTKLMVNHIYGRMAKELVPALMSWNIGTRPIFLCRPGQTISGILTDSEDYVCRDKIDLQDPRFLDMSHGTKRKSLRGDSLGPNGRKFRELLFDFCYDEVHSYMFKRASVHDMAYTGTSVSGLAPFEYLSPTESVEVENGETRQKDPFPMKVFTSTMPRAADTVNWEDYVFTINQNSNLNPLDKGDFAGMELDEIRVSNPTWYSRLEKDPFGTRFPGGECYRDLIRRLTNIVIDLEQQVIPTLVVSHVSILQCLMAYFRNTPVERCMSIEVPLHTVIKYTPVRGGGWKESLHPLFDDESVGCTLEPVQSCSEFSALTAADDVTPIWGDHMIRSPRSSKGIRKIV